MGGVIQQENYNKETQKRLVKIVLKFSKTDNV